MTAVLRQSTQRLFFCQSLWAVMGASLTPQAALELILGGKLDIEQTCAWAAGLLDSQAWAEQASLPPAAEFRAHLLDTVRADAEWLHQQQSSSPRERATPQQEAQRPADAAPGPAPEVQSVLAGLVLPC